MKSKTSYTNCSSYSLSKTNVPKGGSAGNAETDYGSKKVLGKIGSSERRAPQYKLENFSK